MIQIEIQLWISVNNQFTNARHLSKLNRFGPKVGQIGPKLDNSGYFFRSDSVPDLPHFGSIWPTSGLNLVTLYLSQSIVFALSYFQQNSMGVFFEIPSYSETPFFYLIKSKLEIARGYIEWWLGQLHMIVINRVYTDRSDKRRDGTWSRLLCSVHFVMQDRISNKMQQLGASSQLIGITGTYVRIKLI